MWQLYSAYDHADTSQLMLTIYNIINHYNLGMHIISDHSCQSRTSIQDYNENRLAISKKLNIGERPEARAGRRRHSNQDCYQL